MDLREIINNVCVQILKMFTLITAGLSRIIITYDIFNYKTDNCWYNILSHNDQEHGDVFISSQTSVYSVHKIHVSAVNKHLSSMFK